MAGNVVVAAEYAHLALSLDIWWTLTNSVGTIKFYAGRNQTSFGHIERR